jgi:hypothetical protein
MVSKADTGKGCVKVYWQDVRERVAKVEPTFAKLVDDLNPDKTFPLYLMYYPYGAAIEDTKTMFIPKEDGGYDRLIDVNNISKDLMKDLGYGIGSLPMGMILEKNIECCIDMIAEKVTIPCDLRAPGEIFPLGRLVKLQNSRVYSPNGVLKVYSGARSAFLLPNIGCFDQHSFLQRDYNIKLRPAKSSYEQFEVFKAIAESKTSQCDWRSCLLFFSEKWITKIFADDAWSKLQVYLLRLACERFEYERNDNYYKVIYSLILKKRNLKPSPYLSDTARHLIATSLGAAPGFAPSIDDNALPVDTLRKAIMESYRLKTYYPTILQPKKFIFEEATLPVYYSLQNPSTFAFSPKARGSASTLYDLRELSHIINVFIEELAKENSICHDTILHKIAKGIELTSFHTEPDPHGIIHSSDEITLLDPRFAQMDQKYKLKSSKVATGAYFARGCLSIKKK